MKTIALTQGKHAMVDDGDYEWLSRFKWHYGTASKKRLTGYAKTNVRDAISGQKRPIAMHLFIVRPPTGLQVDHRDGNPLNNQRCNLRICSSHQNQFNKTLDRRNQSGFKGVSMSHCGRWRARLKLNGVEKWLGYYDSKNEAASAYDVAAREYYGEFCSTNKGMGLL